MLSVHWVPSAPRRGASVLGLLIVVVIILCITIFWGPMSQDPSTGRTQAEGYINRSQGSACQMNITTMRTQLAQVQMESGSAPLTPKILEKKGILKPCPDGGQYVFHNGQIFCTIHNPPPADAKVETESETTTQTEATTADAPAPAPDQATDSVVNLGPGAATPTPAPQATNSVVNLGVGVGVGIVPTPAP